MSTTVHSRRPSESGASSQRPTGRRGGAAEPGPIPVLIRLPNLGDTKVVAHGGHPTPAPPGGLPASAGKPAELESPAEYRRTRREAQPSGSFWKSVPGKALLAVILVALAIATYALLAGGGGDQEEVLGPEIVWPEAGSGEPTFSNWQQPLADSPAESPSPTAQPKIDEVPIPEPQPVVNYDNVNPYEQRSPAENAYVEQPADDPSSYMPSGEGQAEAITAPIENPHVSQPNRQPTLATPDPTSPEFNANPYENSPAGPEMAYPDLGQPDGASQSDPSRYSDTGSIYSDSRDWMPGGSPQQAGPSQPNGSAVPDQGGEPAYNYPNTGMPELDLRYANRPDNRSAQLPAGPPSTGTAPNYSPRGYLPGANPYPTTRPQNERTGSGLY
ncbi:MAG: hypothetical protein KDA38_11380 [Planctomycetales bacterium]|nr:hypothetical protein [Planctomycetales bacterium]